MEIGPVQMLAFGFDQPKFEGAILGELTKLADADIIRVVDAVVVHKDENGEVETRQFTGLTPEEAEEFGAKVGALVGLGADGEEGIARVTAHIHPDNAPSEGVARALGLAPTTTVVDGEVRWEAR